MCGATQEKSAKIKILWNYSTSTFSRLSGYNLFQCSIFSWKLNLLMRKLIASLAHWTRYSTEHSNHEKEGREIGSRSEWTDRYYKVINCDGIGCLSAHALVWVHGLWTRRGLGSHLGSDEIRRSGDQVTPGDTGEMGKWTVSTQSFIMDKVATIQTGVLMCKYGCKGAGDTLERLWL